MGSGRFILNMTWVHLMVLGTPLVAGVRVIDDAGHDVPSNAWQIDGGNAQDGWDIRLNDLWNPWGNSWFRIEVDAGESIGRLEIAVDGPPAGSPVTITVGEAGFPVKRIDEIVQTGSAEVILHQVNVIERLGRVEVQSINFVDVGGHVHGPIITTDSTSETRGIRSLDVAGDLLGDVLVPDGTIRLLNVLGDVGTSLSPIRIEAGHAIWSMDVRGDVWADVDLCAAGHSGYLHRLEADTFHGALRADRLARPSGSDVPPRVALEGWLNGTWTFQGPLQDDEAVLELPAQGLNGQVVVNALATADGDWTTPLVMAAGQGVPPVMLVGPTYEQVPGLLGGGSVGLVPYRIHATACSPPSGTSLMSAEDAAEVVLRFYGPVQLGWGHPLNIQRRRHDSLDSYEPVAASDFCVEPVEGDPRSVRITAAEAWGGFQAGWSYRIQPNASMLCDLEALVPVSAEVEYIIDLPSAGCEGDVDESGQVNIVDVLLVLALWGQGGTPAGDAADINGDGSVSVDDLLIVIGQWGGCDA